MVTHKVEVFKVQGKFSLMSCFQVDAKDSLELGLSSKIKQSRH